MSTQLPPPKRQKLHNVPHERDVRPTKVAEEPERFIPNIVVQFKNAEDGSPLGPAINLPANTGRDALQMLVNKLKGEVSHIVLTVRSVPHLLIARLLYPLSVARRASSLCLPHTIKNHATTSTIGSSCSSPCSDTSTFFSSANQWQHPR